MQGFNAFMPVNAFLKCGGRSFRIESGQLTEAICRSFDAQLAFSDIERYDANEFLEKLCTLSVEDAHGEKRTWVGECSSFTSQTDDGKQWHYTLSFESILSRLKKSYVHFRTEAEVDLKSWVKSTFKRHGISSESLEWRFHFNEVRPRLIQVLQSDYDFLLKILAQESIIMWPSTDKSMICFANDPAQWKNGTLERIFYVSQNDLIQHGGEKIGVYEYQDVYQHIRSPDEEDATKEWEKKSPERLYSGVPYLLEGMGGPALKPFKNIQYDRKSIEALFHRRATNKHEEGAVYRYVDASSNALAIAVGNGLSLVDVAKGEEMRGRVSYVRHEFLSVGKTLRYRNRFLLQPAMSPWRAVSPLKPTLPLVMQAYIDGNDAAPMLNAFGEEQVSFPGDASDKPVAFDVPRMRTYVNHQGGMSFPLGHRTEVLISFLYGESDLPVIVGALPNLDNPSPVNGSNPSDHILSTRSGNKLRFHDDAAQASVSLETSPTHGVWLQNGAGVNLRSEGGFVLDVNKRILCQIGKTWNMLSGGSMTCTAGVSQNFQTHEGDIVISSAMHIESHIQKSMSLFFKSHMKMHDKQFKMHVKKDATITIKNGETRYQIKGAVTIQSGDGIKISGNDRVVIQSGDEGSGFIIERDQITLYGKNLVGVETDTLALNGNVSFGTAARTSSPVHALRDLVDEEASEKVKKLVLHRINVTEQSTLYGETVNSGELDEFFFHIAEEAITLEEFVENLYLDPEDAHVLNLKTVNQHIKGLIEPGQMVYVTNAKGSVFQKFKSELARSAGVIDSLRIQMPPEDVACFAQNFALLGSFASSVGEKKGVYLGKNKDGEKAATDKSAGLIPFATDAFLQFYAGYISGRIDEYNLSNPSHVAKQADFMKRSEVMAKEMMDAIIGNAEMSTSMKIDAVLRAGNANGSWMNYVERIWVAPSKLFMRLDDFYECILFAQKTLSWFGNINLLFDISEKHTELELSCRDLNEKECRRLNVEHWSEFAGKTVAEMSVSKSLGFVLQFSGKRVKNPIVSVAATGVGAFIPNMEITPDDVGKFTKEYALIFHDLYYGNESESKEAAEMLKEMTNGILF